MIRTASISVNAIDMMLLFLVKLQKQVIFNGPLGNWDNRSVNFEAMKGNSERKCGKTC